MNIVLIEQSGDILAALSKHVEAEGHQVTSFKTPGEALPALLQGKHDGKTQPDLVILDIVHEGQINGAEVVHRLREHLPTLKVILIKGTTSEDERIVDEYLLNIQLVKKPIKPMLLLQEVHKHLPKP